MSAGVPEHVQEFVFAAATHEDLAASVEDTGEVVVTSSAHDGRDTVMFDQVCSLAHTHDLRVVGGAGHFDDGVVEVVVADGEWTRGGDER